MSWWGKIVGGTFGFMMGGPLGAVLGAALGHQFDQGMKGVDEAELEGLNPGAQERVQTAFFTATFSVMGYIAKADGKVTPDEIAAAEGVMNEMQLTAQQRKAAIALFQEGKSADFPLREAVEQFRQECQRRRNLMQMFLEIQLFAALADGQMHANEQRAIRDIAGWLGFTAAELAQLQAAVQAHHQRGASAQPKKPSIDQSYAILGVDKGASDAEVKKAYRRLMSQHHPDKLVAKGLPEEMMKVATEKTHEIRQAYEAIKAARGF